MRLHRLTGLEQDKLTKEYEEILELVKDLLAILSDPERLMEVIREELVEVLDQYGDERRTEIIEQRLDLSLEDLMDIWVVSDCMGKGSHLTAEEQADLVAYLRTL